MFCDGSPHLAAAGLHDLQRNVGVALFKPRHDLGNHVAGKGGAGSEPHVTHRQSLQFCHLLVQPVRSGDELADGADQFLAGAGEGHAAAAAEQERHTEIFLQRVHHVGHPGRGVAQFFCRFRKTPSVDSPQQHFTFFCIHGSLIRTYTGRIPRTAWRRPSCRLRRRSPGDSGRTCRGWRCRWRARRPWSDAWRRHRCRQR